MCHSRCIPLPGGVLLYINGLKYVGDPSNRCSLKYARFLEEFTGAVICLVLFEYFLRLLSLTILQCMSMLEVLLKCLCIMLGHLPVFKVFTLFLKECFRTDFYLEMRYMLVVS